MPFPAPWLLRTVGMRPRLPPPAMCDRETLRVDVWIGHTAAGARLDGRSEVRCVRDDVSVSLLIDSPVFSRSHSLHLRYLESPLPSSDRQMRSQASARFWLSMTLFGPERFHPFVFLPSDLVKEHVFSVCAQCRPRKVSPFHHCKLEFCVCVEVLHPC